MEITTSAKNGFSVIYLSGRADSMHVSAFERYMLDHIAAGESKLIINCRDLKYISSLGLRVFLIAQKKIIEKKGKLFLCELTKPVLETIAISGFSTIFRIFETEEEALGA